MWNKFSKGEKIGSVAGLVSVAVLVIYFATKKTAQKESDGSFNTETPQESAIFNSTTQDAYQPSSSQITNYQNTGLGITEDQSFNQALKQNTPNYNDQTTPNWFKRTFGFTGIQNT